MLEECTVHAHPHVPAPSQQQILLMDGSCAGRGKIHAYANFVHAQAQMAQRCDSIPA